MCCQAADIAEEDFKFEHPEDGEEEEEGMTPPGFGSEISIVLAILASEQFCKVFGHWPGQNAGDPASDVAEVERLAGKALATVHAETGELPKKLTDAIAEV